MSSPAHVVRATEWHELSQASAVRRLRTANQDGIGGHASMAPLLGHSIASTRQSRGRNCETQVPRRPLLSPRDNRQRACTTRHMQVHDKRQNKAVKTDVSELRSLRSEVGVKAASSCGLFEELVLAQKQPRISQGNPEFPDIAREQPTACSQANVANLDPKWWVQLFGGKRARMSVFRDSRAFALIALMGRSPD